MTQLEQLIAMLESSKTHYIKRDWRESCYPENTVSIELTSNSEETDFNFDALTGELKSVEITSSHYSD